MIGSYVLRAIRWKYILMDPGLKFHNLFSASMIGNMGNNIFPMHLGEIIRCYVLGDQEGISKSTIFASVVFERVLDGVAVFFFFSISLIFVNLGSAFITSAIVAFSIFFFILLFIILSENHLDILLKLLSIILFFLPKKTIQKINDILISFMKGFKIIQNKKFLLISIGYSLLFWGVGIVGTYFLLLSTENKIPFSLPIVLTTALVIGLMLPSAPGYIGTFHYVVILVLTMYGWEKESAASTSIILHGIQFAIPIIIGLYFVFKLGLNIKKLSMYN